MILLQCWSFKKPQRKSVQVHNLYTYTIINDFKSLLLPSSKRHLFVYPVGRNTLC